MGLLVDGNGACSTDNLSARPAYAAAFFAGVVVHLIFFRVGEWDLYVVPLVVALAIADGAGAAALTRFCPGVELPESLKLISSLIGLSVAGIFSSITVYRAAFHRLNRFPGPFMARLSNFYITRRSIKKFRL